MESSISNKDFLSWAVGGEPPWLQVDVSVEELPPLGIICIPFILKDQPTQSFCIHFSPYLQISHTCL